VAYERVKPTYWLHSITSPLCIQYRSHRLYGSRHSGWFMRLYSDYLLEGGCLYSNPKSQVD